MKNNNINMFKLIMSKVTGVTGIMESEILGKSRQMNIVEARHIVRYLCIKLGMTYNKTAELTNCNHTTVISSVRRIDNLMFTDRKFKQKIELNYAEYITGRVRKPVYIIGKFNKQSTSIHKIKEFYQIKRI